MEKKHYIKLLEESILQKIESVPMNMFVYNDGRGWNECSIDCLFSYKYKHPNKGRIILYTDFNRIVDMDGERFIFSDKYGKLFNMYEKFSNGEKIYGRAEFTEYEWLVDWVDKSLCSFEEHMIYVADETNKVISKYGKFIRNGTYFKDSEVSEDFVFKIASDIKYKCNEGQILFYVDVETYDIDYKNSSLVKREVPYYNGRCVELLKEIKDSIIEDVRSFIEEKRAVKIKEIDEQIDNLMRQKEEFGY